ncbi:hypothetical protein PU088_002923 [Citrobacter farmeri]|uniref:hypothetical protein n=1 Tax=Citrobacter amalonaticus TaxID=35703 RepID=UPI000A55A5D6|nr:hypothetical protein [Citrobacter amalonaticus]EKV5655416.1 hypothetical protein [Citrobacter farmeri]
MMKKINLITLFIITVPLLVSSKLYAGVNPDGSITFTGGQIQFASAFNWGQSVPDPTASIGFTTTPNVFAIGNSAATTTIAYINNAQATNVANHFLTQITPLCGGGATASGSQTTVTVDLTRCYVQPTSNILYVYRVTTPGGWANCKSTAIAGSVIRMVTPSSGNSVYTYIISATGNDRTYDSDGALTSSTIASATITRGTSSTLTTYRSFSAYETIINVTETPLVEFMSSRGSDHMFSCAGERYYVLPVSVSVTSGYIRFASGLQTEHMRVISSTLAGYTPQQVNNPYIAPALDVFPSVNITVGNIAGYTYPSWHEYPFQIRAIADVTYNMGASTSFPALVAWNCPTPTGSVSFEIRNVSGVNLCGAPATTHAAVTTPFDARFAWRPSSPAATGAWTARATVTYTLP